MDTVEVVIRCKDEIEWLPRVIDSINSQSLKPRKVIVIDDSSSDGSREYASAQGCHIIDYGNDKFNYSRALNIGLQAVSSDSALLLSAHCVLYDNFAIEKLMKSLEFPSVVGAFGRQIPTSNSSDLDIRDLLTVFGRERLVYEQYPFFHNAFSLVNMSYWKNNPFSEETNGIEDRMWAYDACAKGFKIVYEPSAIAFHEHGLNQGCSLPRAKRVVNALRLLHKGDIPITSNI